MPFLSHDELRFHFMDRGQGTPVVFQHGVGGDTERIFAQIEVPPGFRLLGMDCRGHGRTQPLGDPAKLGFDQFSNDVLVLLDHLSIQRAVVGGTSMGAAVALNFAVRFPHRLLGLALLRPAWLDAPNPANARLFAEIARLLRLSGPSAGLEQFKKSELYANIANVSADSAASLLALFSDGRAMETASCLERIPQDAPVRNRNEWRSIAVPTLVMATDRDPIHPLAYARSLADLIPHAHWRELPPKSTDLARYLVELRLALGDFLLEHFAHST